MAEAGERTPDEVRADIEKGFAEVTARNLRTQQRALNALIARLPDPRERARYEAALDLLPDMLKHDSSANEPR
ncbi:MAG: hypothetical protein VKP62_03575 [Candidatus Sericytochromatia bacterium]|nr:hypothetical protein [Candidatus Sericytochromatia bacterium]